MFHHDSHDDDGSSSLSALSPVSCVSHLAGESMCAVEICGKKKRGTKKWEAEG